MTIYSDGAIIGNGSNAITGIGSEFMGSPATIAQTAMITANLIRTVNIKNVRAVSSTRIRVEFSQSIANGASSLLSDPDSFVLTAVGGAAVSLISRVDTPDGAAATPSIDLIVSEMTQGVLNYTLAAHGLFAPDQSPISNGAFAFNGFGVAPKVLVAFASDANSVTVQFTEKVLDIGSLRDTSAYVFDGGLAVTGILGVDASSVTLKTSAQTPGHLYTLTMSGSWFDNALNQLVSPAASSMLGFTAAVAKSALFSLKMYNFLIEGLRNSDQQDGNQFLERFLMGPQAIWAATMKTIFNVPSLWDVSTIPDELLQYLKRIVGWTHDLDNITDDLDAATLRRLIAASVRFWKERGPEEAISNILSLTTGARSYVLNWFDLRFILDQTMLGEEHLGTDPWVLSTPGEGDPDSQTYNIRIVDNGSLNHALVRNLAKLTRPSGERIRINYLGFLDRFESNGDETQWAFSVPDHVSRHVSGGVLRFDTTAALVNIDGDTLVNAGGSWLTGNSSVVDSSISAMVTVENNQEFASYVASWTFSTDMMEPSLIFYAIGEPSDPASIQDYYAISIGTERDSSSSNTIRLVKVEAGVTTVLASFDTTTIGEPFRINTTYTIRVEVTPRREGSIINSICVYWDGEPIINDTSDSTFAQGTLGLKLETGAVTSSYFELKELEMFFVPASYDTIGLGNATTSVFGSLGTGAQDNAIPDGAMTFDDGSFVVFDDGSFAVTA